ncbi:MAG: hypothetical protein HYX68_20975 [Planctomycetes bacterium]|nr:hypothetical protein [Planctomycetota bacterium]
MTFRQIVTFALLLSTIAGCDGRYHSGDRVLVSKCSYDNGITSPSRSDVVVFKYPVKPIENHTPKNFIKRLLGLPEEIIAIFFGRLYRWAPTPGTPPPFDDRNGVDADGKKVNPNDLWQETYVHKNAQKSKDLFTAGKFEILRKPPEVMLAMRRIVYDNDYQAADLKKIGFPDRWAPTPESSWKKDQQTGFSNDGKSVDKVAWLRYQHLIRPDGPLAGNQAVKPTLILDSLGYNTFQLFPDQEAEGAAGLRNRVYKHANWVGDLMVECDIEVAEAKGEFWLELSKGFDRFQARWDLASGQCTLYRVGKDKVAKELAVESTRVKGAGKYMLRLANIDARLTVWVDRQLPFGDGKTYDPPEMLSAQDRAANLKWEDTFARRGPTENDLQPASVGSKGADVKVSHLRIWRDTYYRTNLHGGDTGEEMSREAWSSPERWDELRKVFNFTTMYVQPGHYLCLGDNSEASDDSRNWGLVPHRLMLGRALAVYYPLDRIGPIR